MRSRRLSAASVDPTEARSASAEDCRGDWTPLKLFLVGIRTLVSQLSITTKALAAILDSACSDPPALEYYARTERPGWANHRRFAQSRH
jgi:hypothetical protein